MSEIRVDPQFLTNLASRARRAATDLENYTRHGGCHLDSAPSVESAYRELGGRWDHSRGKLVKELNALGDAISTAREAFVVADRSSADQLRQSEGG
ncbi:MAG: hypothetical protein OXC06_19505 [Acidimicrobiaceae bacterium]|nr:hypothetical protein [Acidimicrobiaceae bacterium]